MNKSQTIEPQTLGHYWHLFKEGWWMIALVILFFVSFVYYFSEYRGTEDCQPDYQSGSCYPN